MRDDNPSINGSVILTWANGNERGGGAGRCGASYVTTAPPSCAKNPIQVGALNSDGGSMTSFSSWGPCDDGRMKPVISAPGCETGRVTGETSIYSSLNGSTTSYGGFCGTSMATPRLLLARRQQRQRQRLHGLLLGNDANAANRPQLVIIYQP